MKSYEIFFGFDAKMRSGWRFAIFCLAYLFTSSLAFGLGGWLLRSLSSASSPSAVSMFVIGSLFGLIPAILISWLCGRILEHLPFQALGASFTSNWLTNLILGVLIGAGTLSLSVGIASIFGDLDFSMNAANASAIGETMLASFVVFAVAAAFEEVLFRGYILQTFVRSRLASVGLILTSLIFATVHNGNPSADFLSWLNTFLAGIWFGVAYLKTRDLWLVWGLHLMWNWMQGAVFGIEVSGLTEIVRSPLLKEIDAGPEWLTGGNYGIEASIACTIALIVSTVAIYYLPFLKPSEELLELQKPARK